jgi:hypothetical protein
MSTETRYYRNRTTQNVAKYEPGIGGFPKDIYEPVAVIPQAEYDRLKRLEAEVEDDALVPTVAGGSKTIGERAVAAGARAYRAALRRAAKGET